MQFTSPTAPPSIQNKVLEAQAVEKIYWLKFHGDNQGVKFCKKYITARPFSMLACPKQTWLICVTSCNTKEGEHLGHHKLLSATVPLPALPWQYLFWYISQGWPICLISLIRPSRMSIWSFAWAKHSSRSLFPLIWTPSPYFNSWRKKEERDGD